MATANLVAGRGNRTDELILFVAQYAIRLAQNDFDAEAPIQGNQSGTVQFRHGGKLGGEVDLATGTAAQIAASFLSLADGVCQIRISIHSLRRSAALSLSMTH